MNVAAVPWAAAGGAWVGCHRSGTEIQMCCQSHAGIGKATGLTWHCVGAVLHAGGTGLW